jgi:hypothetical protein
MNAKKRKTGHDWDLMPHEIYSSLSTVGQRESKNQPAGIDRSVVSQAYRGGSELTSLILKDRCVPGIFDTCSVTHSQQRAAYAELT